MSEEMQENGNANGAEVEVPEIELIIKVSFFVQFFLVLWGVFHIFLWINLYGVCFMAFFI